MPAISYEQLALSWKPETKTDRLFMLIAASAIIVMLLAGIIISSIKVPQQQREARVEVPERIANFILEKPKPKPKVIPKVLPKPKPKPKEIEKPKIKKLPRDKAPRKPLSEIQQKAREKAASTGLLALGNELADLMDTSDVTAMVGGAVNSSTGSAQTISDNSKALLLADASKGSGGVNSSEYATTTVGKTSLSQREITRVKQALLAPEVLVKSQPASASEKDQATTSAKPRTTGIRAEEGITIVFDQNKSKLYSIYNRARRKNPTLKGKIVLEITVAPSGSVSSIRVVSSELNDSTLETRLVNRIKQFNFGAQKVETITVIYPIEFLPS